MVLVLACGAFAGTPATVVEHKIGIVVDASQRLVETQTWAVRIDDPAALTAGLLAPPGLDGATDRGAVVLEDLLILPAETPPGTVYTLTSRRAAPRGGHSGLFVTAPELPVAHAELVVDVPLAAPLGVWADPSADPSFEARRTRRVTMSWTDIAPGERGNAVWSTFPDWLTAAEGTLAQVGSRLADRGALGRDVAADLQGLGVAGLAERTTELVALEEGEPGTWATSRSATEILASRTGTAAERGIVLLSLLGAAGIDATPGWFRPADAPGSFPVTIPAPALLAHPLVVVRRPDGDVFVDPATDRAAIPERPASLVGATVWVPGELPTRLSATGITDGHVSVATTLSIAGDGSATWSASIQATGVAQEALRDLLHPLDDAGRTEAFTRLLHEGRPGLTRVQTSVTGADKASRRLKITLGGHDDAGTFAQVGFGLSGTVAPTLAPALAAWLPPHLAVTETVSIAPPAALQIVGTTVAPSLYRPEALVSRSVRREGHDLVLTVEVERPYRRTTPARDAAAATFLASEAPKGVALLLFTAASGAAVKALRSDPTMEPAGRAVLEALLWLADDNARKASKALGRARENLGITPLLAELGHTGNRADLRPWLVLDGIVEDDDRARIEVVEALEQISARRPAWERAVVLADSPVPDVAVRALLAVQRLQGPVAEPGGETPAWREPIELVTLAAERAKEVTGATAPDPRVVYPLAALRLEAGDAASAEALLESIPGGTRSALADALLALAAATGGVPLAEVRSKIDLAVAGDPFDPDVVGTAARAASKVGDHRTAALLSVTAARLAHDDPDRWSAAVGPALAAGDLPTAADAAERASDLDSESTARALAWERVATLLLDREGVDEARRRAHLAPIADGSAGGWPPSVEERSALAPDALLALLQFADAGVSADPRLLAMRAQLRIDAGMLDEAARDGLDLATRHGDLQGVALAFAATAGRQYSKALSAALDSAARTDPTAQTTRMEVRLIAGTGDPLEDARRLGDEPRGAALVAAVTRPGTYATALPGWPTSLRTAPKRAPPPGYRVNKALSAARGVLGFSHPEAGRAVVRVSAVIGLLPPPIGVLYTQNPQAVERLDGGGQVLHLEGGVIPLYAAVAIDGTQEVWGFGFTIDGARRALADGLGR